MILFLDDWKKYPGAIIDTETKNRSFVRLAALYKQMGIKNHAFILALVDTSLQGVDPFDPNLTMRQKLQIAMECKINPWYYFREVAKAPSQSGNETNPVEANRGNIALYWLFFNHIMLFLIQIRQTGKSFSVDQLSTYLLNIRCSNTQINLLTKDDTLRNANIKRLKDIDSELPEYLRQRSKADVNNTEMLSIKSLGNSYLAHVPQKSPKAALNVGRGLTSPIFLIDEGPFQPNIGISLPAALAAGTAARDIAKRMGEPYGTILTTTAGKRDDKDGKFIYEMLQESADWTEKFFDCKDIEELELTIRRAGKGHLRVNCTFSHTQLGKNDIWLKEAIEATASKDVDAINRDFFNTWTTGTQSSPLPVHLLEKMRKSESQEVFTSIDSLGGYVTQWFIPEDQIEKRMRSGHYVMGMDTSDASGGDDISLFIIDIATAETIAVGTYNETNLIVFAKWLATWFQKYDNLTAIIERRSTGVMIIDYLLHILPSMGIDPFKRLFNTAVNNHAEYPDRWQEINQPLYRRPADCYVAHKKCFGFSTSGSGMTSRTELYSTTLHQAAKKGSDKIKHKKTIDQITGLITLNGRVDHAAGGHDDLVISWLLAFWLITLGKNLSFYGINSKSILCEVDLPKEMDARTYMRYQEQALLRENMTKLLEEMERERDENVMFKLEHRLRQFNRQLVLEEGEQFSVDDFINSLRTKRKTDKFTRKDNPSRYDNIREEHYHHAGGMNNQGRIVQYA